MLASKFNMVKLNKLFLLPFFLAAVSCTAAAAPVQPADIDFSYMKFVYDATKLPLQETYDYIVVGGGTTGCPLAATLSENYKVLVLERGGTPSQHPSVLSSTGYTTNLLEADTFKDSPAQEFVSEEGSRFARGRILGGTSMINAAFYSRADPRFYSDFGIDWDMDLVTNAYQWVEETIVSHNLEPRLWQYAVKEALLEIGIGPDNGFTLDHVEGTKTSGSIFDEARRRHGSVELLNKANFDNIKVGVHATVAKIIFSTSNSSSSGLTAAGVIYEDSEGNLHKALVREKGEVILSAGALGSPQLLLLSGIGPKSHLSSMNIPLVFDNPYVGQFMQDMPRHTIHIELPFSAPSLAQVVGIISNLTYIETQSSAFSFYFPSKCGISYASDVPSSIDIGSIAVKSAKVYSRGHLHLASSSNISANPIVRFNYFQVAADLEICVAKLRTAAQLFKTEAMEVFKFQDINGTKYFKFLGVPLPSNLFDEAAMESYCRTTLASFWHYHGGCLVGKVVDENLMVKGIDALRVVDFSTSASSPGTNPQAALMMLGRYVGLRVVQHREKSSSTFDRLGTSFDYSEL